MRLKPLRGQTYETDGGPVQFLEITPLGQVKVIVYDAQRVIPVEHLNLPIIDTKDYENIQEDKHAGH